MKPQLSIIIVNYNTADLTLSCLASINKYLDLSQIEIILVDNKSKDNSIKLISEKFPSVKIISNPENYGFGKANNIGAQKACGNYLLFLNSDTKFTSNALTPLLAKADPQTIYGIKLLNANGSLQPSAGYFPTLRRLVNQMFFIDDLSIFSLTKYQQTEKSFYQKDHWVDWVTGAFIFIPKQIFNQIHGFDDKIFMYGEEVDLCYRAKQIGAKVKYLSLPKIYHLKGGSSRNGFERAILGEFKGLVTFYKKHWPAKLPQLKFILKLGALLRILVFAIINCDKSKTYFKAYKTI